VDIIFSIGDISWDLYKLIMQTIIYIPYGAKHVRHENGMDQVDRQNKVRDLLEQEIGVDSQQVGVLLTYSPQELNVMNGE
jgi:hypothetical protein